MPSISLRVLLLPLALACGHASSGEETRGPEGSLIGTWRAVEYVVAHAEDSARRYPFGRPPRGYLVYDATGHVFLQVVRGLAASSEARGRWRGADSATLYELLNGSTAYFGEYHADYSTRKVAHRLEAEIPPNLGMTEIASPFELRGDTLQLGADSTAHWTFVRVHPSS